MLERSNTSHWTRHFIYRTEHYRTTWKFRLGLLVFVVLAVWFTRGWWTVTIAQSLVCEANVGPSDAILVENFDPDFRMFERAARLRKAGLAARVMVPVQSAADSSEPNPIAQGTVEVMGKFARLDAMDIVPIRTIEPISLNAAYDVLRFVEREHIRSVIVVSPLFRSRRSALVYGATLGRAGITVRCDPGQGVDRWNTWIQTWHGVQNVAEQWIKLQYYRLYVLPFRARAQSQQPLVGSAG
jgi:hypothetical protein